MLAYNAHCMLIQCSQKDFIKFASRRYDDTPSLAPPIIPGYAFMLFDRQFFVRAQNIFLSAPTDIWATDEKLFGS